MTAAGMATQRAQRAFFQHRKAKRDGLIVPAAAELAEPPANQNGTNENTSEPDRPLALPAPAAPDSRKCTNELPAPGHAEPESRSHPCAPASTACWPAPAPKSPEEWDLIAAIRALKLPGAAPYRGPIDPGDLEPAPGRAPLRRRRPRLAGLAPARARRTRAAAAGGNRMTEPAAPRLAAAQKATPSRPTACQPWSPPR